MCTSITTSGRMDAMIFGGGLCGVGAALALAAEGQKVSIIERRASLAWEATAAFQCELASSAGEQ